LWKRSTLGRIAGPLALDLEDVCDALVSLRHEWLASIEFRDRDSSEAEQVSLSQSRGCGGGRRGLESRPSESYGGRRCRPHRSSQSGARSAAGRLHPAWDGSRSPEGRLILVVEDDDATRAFLLDNLIADGFRVAGASGVGEGLRAIEVRQPALVVLDLALEDGNGPGLLDRVRASDGLSSRIDPDLPVIVLSGRAGDADRVRSFARGADDHVTKPTCLLVSAL
jgi:CheY-like chemotaxis protein